MRLGGERALPVDRGMVHLQPTQLAVDLEGAMAMAGYHSKYPTVSAGFKA